MVDTIILPAAGIGILVSVLTELFKYFPSIKESKQKKRIATLVISIIASAVYCAYSNVFFGLDIIGVMMTVLGTSFVVYKTVIKSFYSDIPKTE